MQTKDTTQKGNQDRIYLLCEEHEDDNGNLDFTVHTASRDYESLKKLLNAKFEKDEYGLIAENGLWGHESDYFETNFEGSCVKFYILQQDLLDRDQTLDLLDTIEFDPVFRHPDNLRDIVRSTLAKTMETESFRSYNADVATEHVMADKEFHTAVKRSWWGTCAHLKDQEIQFAENEVGSYIARRLCEDQDWFVTIGAAERPHYPKNLIDLVIDSIYDVAKDYHLPVNDVEKSAKYLMQRNDFHDLFGGMENSEYIAVGSKEYEHVLHACNRYIRKLNDNTTVQARIDDAIQRQAAQKPTNLQKTTHERN